MEDKSVAQAGESVGTRVFDKSLPSRSHVARRSKITHLQALQSRNLVLRKFVPPSTFPIRPLYTCVTSIKDNDEPIQKGNDS